MPNCAVQNCKSWNMNKNVDKNVKFFSFPTDPEIRNLWMRACGKGTFNIKNARICSLHFIEDHWRLKDKLLNTELKNKCLKKTPFCYPKVKIV